MVPASTRAWISATWAGRDPGRLQLHPGLVGPPGDLGQPPLAGGLRRGAGGDRGLDQVHRAGVDHVPQLQLGEAPVRAEPLQAYAGRLGQRRPQLLHPLPASGRSAPGPARGSSGSPPRRSLLRPAVVSPVSSCQCRVSWVIRAAAVQHRGLPGDLVADRPLHAAQRVDVLGLGPGARTARPGPAAARRWRRSAASPAPSGRRRRPAPAAGRAASPTYARATSGALAPVPSIGLVTISISGTPDRL